MMSLIRDWILMMSLIITILRMPYRKYAHLFQEHWDWAYNRERRVFTRMYTPTPVLIVPTIITVEV